MFNTTKLSLQLAIDGSRLSFPPLHGPALPQCSWKGPNGLDAQCVQAARVKVGLNPAHWYMDPEDPNGGGDWKLCLSHALATLDILAGCGGVAWAELDGTYPW